MKWYYYVFIVIFVIVIFNIALYFYARDQDNNVKELRKIPEQERYDILENMLAYVLSVTKENDIEIIPSYGTLLGLVREKQIIRHDYDVDLYLFEKEWKTLKDIISKEDRYLFHETNILWHKKFKIYDRNRPNVSTDFFVLYEGKNIVKQDVLLSNGIEGVKDGNIDMKSPFRIKYEKDDFFPLNKKPTKYGDVHFPNKPENLLVKWYGDNWITPKL